MTTAQQVYIEKGTVNDTFFAGDLMFCRFEDGNPVMYTGWLTTEESKTTPKTPVIYNFGIDTASMKRCVETDQFSEVYSDGFTGTKLYQFKWGDFPRFGIGFFGLADGEVNMVTFASDIESVDHPMIQSYINGYKAIDQQ
jgi:hypothetical protein